MFIELEPVFLKTKTADFMMQGPTQNEPMTHFVPKGKESLKKNCAAVRTLEPIKLSQKPWLVCTPRKVKTDPQMLHTAFYGKNRKEKDTG